MDKLELKHLAPYLPYKLKCEFERTYENTIEILVGIEKTDKNYVCLFGEFGEFIPTQVKPILRPLSDLTKKEMKQFGFDEYDGTKPHCIRKRNVWYMVTSLSYCQFIDLCSLHVDVFGLIEKGLAIDINSLKS